MKKACSMNAPNQVTLLRILLIPLFLYFLTAKELPMGNILAALFFLGLSFSDALDGYLARKLKQTTSLGKLLDPLADKLLVYGAFLVLIETGRLWSLPVLIIIARDFGVMGIRVWAAKKGTIIAASDMGKWKTASQMAAILLLILNWPFWQIILGISLLLSLMSGWEYFKQLELEDD